MDMTTYMQNVVGNHLLRNQAFTPPATLYLALYTTATDAAGGGTEVTGGSYARQGITLAAFAGGASSNTVALSFSNMPAVTVTHGALLDAATGGNMWMHGDLPAPKPVTLGATITVPIGDLDVAFT